MSEPLGRWQTNLKVPRKSEPRFTKRKSCLSAPGAFYTETVGFTGMGEQMGTVWPYTIPTEKLMKDGLADKIVMWTGNWLEGQAQKLVIKAMKPSWRSVSSNVHQGSTLGLILFIIFINNQGHNGPLTCLQMTQNRKEWQIHQTVVPDRPQEAGKMGWQAPYQVQQGQVQRPAFGDEQPQAPLRWGTIPEWAAGKQLCKEPAGHEDQQCALAAKVTGYPGCIGSSAASR